MQLFFEPFQFLQNLVYMGRGMVGIFAVILLMIGMVSLLNKLSSPKK